MEALHTALNVLLIITSGFLILTILMQKGKGGGVSDMFGGGISSSIGGSGVASRNLQRITVGMSLLWVTVIIMLGLIVRYQS